MVNSFFYNNLSRIMINLQESMALVCDFENWSNYEEELVSNLKKLAKNYELNTTLLVPVTREINTGLWNYENIKKLADKKNITNVIFYVLNDFTTDDNQEYLHSNLYEFLNIKKIIVLDNFKIKNTTVFSSEFFKKFWNNNCFLIEETIDEQKNSLRKILLEADFKKFKEKTGLYYKISGRVSEGKKMGRNLGFPTINLLTPEPILLSEGVYACDVHIKHLAKSYKGAGCYWINELNQKVLEINILDFDKDIYGWEVEITPICKLRNNKKVNTIEELKELLKQDVEKVRQTEINIS